MIELNKGYKIEVPDTKEPVKSPVVIWNLTFDEYNKIEEFSRILATTNESNINENKDSLMALFRQIKDFRMPLSFIINVKNTFEKLGLKE